MSNHVYLYTAGELYEGPAIKAVFSNEDEAKKFWKNSGLPNITNNPVSHAMYHENSSWWHSITRVPYNPRSILSLVLDVNIIHRQCGVRELEVEI